jgi:hypothetical protein
MASTGLHAGARAGIWGGESTMRKRANAPLPGGRSFLQAAGELVDGA